jgi:hypothetical protein
VHRRAKGSEYSDEKKLLEHASRSNGPPVSANTAIAETMSTPWIASRVAPAGGLMVTASPKTIDCPATSAANVIRRRPFVRSPRSEAASGEQQQQADMGSIHPFTPQLSTHKSQEVGRV